MSSFCRVFENQKGEQLLILKDYDTDSEKYEVQFIFEFAGASGKASIGNIIHEESADKILKYWNQEKAEEFLQSPLVNSLKEMKRIFNNL